jgi:hypothetical protein
MNPQISMLELLSFFEMFNQLLSFQALIYGVDKMTPNFQG